MLRQLSIRDYTLIDVLELEFEAGLTVLTGETGAGKSIVIDALGLALGDRGDSRAIRPGASRAEIVAVFSVDDNRSARDWLSERELDHEDDCFLRRVVNAQGRSRAWINGQPMPLQDLRALGACLVDLHGQSEHQSLLLRATQRRLLDDYAGLQQNVNEVQAAWQSWRDVSRELEELRQATKQREERRTLLNYQVDELTSLDIAPDEFESLSSEQQRLASAEEIGDALATIVKVCSNDDETAICAMLDQCQATLVRLPNYSGELSEARELLETARIQVDEAQRLLLEICDKSRVNPARLVEVEARLSIIHQVARKYRVDTHLLTQLQLDLHSELSKLIDADQRQETIEQSLDDALKQYEVCAKRLGNLRLDAAQELAAKVQSHLHNLAMQHCRFEISLQAVAGEPQQYGRERSEFLVATIPGNEPATLSRVASGGELSRISLAIQVVTAATSVTPTIVFDEVDVGIGGATAEIVGRLLRRLGSAGQTLCVTHLPQVAACGHQHMKVSKLTTMVSASAALQLLEPRARIEEIARMLGGKKLTEASRNHARELLALTD